MDFLTRWKRAAVHLECATDSESLNRRIERWDTLRERFDEGDISQEDLADQYLHGSRDVRSHGTAILLEHERRRYLLTARHVVFDELSAKRELEEEVQRLQSAPADFRNSVLESAQQRACNRVFNIIFRVPTLDEILQRGPNASRGFVMNLQAGASWAIPYTFSEPELDLAIISLDQRDSKFGDELSILGYEPIHLADVSDEPSAEGVEVFTVGYPSATAFLGQLDLHPAKAQWSSAYVSVATLAFGRVSMLHQMLNYFWCDMSIYPGNSGGPVIENEKAVGIVSRQPGLPIENFDELGQARSLLVGKYRIPFAKVIKAKYIKPVLEQQIEKDRNQRV